MSTVEQQLPRLVGGERLTLAEFLRYGANPKLAELLGGIVYLPPPWGVDHGDMSARLNFWLGHYSIFTPGCDALSHATWLMGEDAPQPDVSVCIRPEYGGLSQLDGLYPRGVPEFLVEVCLSRTDRDLHQKLELYQREGVPEYLVVLVDEPEIRWHRLVNGYFQLIPASPDGWWRSVTLPGLWLHKTVLYEDYGAEILATLTQGLNSAEHAAFVAQLQQRRT